MTATIDPTTFPLDGILTCGTCGCAMALQHNPLPQYACQNSCDVPAFKAIELNHLAIKTLYNVLVTDHTRDAFTKQMEGAFDQLKEEQPTVAVDWTTDGRADPRDAGRPAGHPATRVHERRALMRSAKP